MFGVGSSAESRENVRILSGQTGAVFEESSISRPQEQEAESRLLSVEIWKREA